MDGVDIPEDHLIHRCAEGRPDSMGADAAAKIQHQPAGMIRHQA